MTYQSDQGQLKVYQVRSNVVGQLINQTYYQEEGINQAQNLLYEKRANEQYIFLLYFFQEVKQLEYFSLSNYDPQLPSDPTTSDFQDAQVLLVEAINQAISSRSTGPTSCWARFTLSSSVYQNSFSSLWDNNTMSVMITFPNLTNYYMVYFTDVHLYLNFGAGQPPLDEIITVNLVHGGESFFLDENELPWNFTHAPLQYPFYYNSSTLCPTSSPWSAPDYINYSPFGRWTISLPTNQGFNISAIESVVFEFELYFYQRATPLRYPLFGRDENWQSDTCVSPLGSNCPTNLPGGEKARHFQEELIVSTF